MPQGKKAGERCVNLDPRSLLCGLWGTDAYPDVCRRFAPEEDVCGTTRDEALGLITILELQTASP